MTRPRCTRARAIAAALLAAGAASAEPAPVSVWYRTSEGCPDGESFIARLNGLGQSARLASVGDRVDFVVTLGHDEGLSSGRLERQTRSGTVAIREYRDSDCAQVAEALALTLDLALDPGAISPAEAATTAPATKPSTPALRPLPAAVATTAGEAHVIDAAPRSMPGGREASRTKAALGAQALLATGVAPDLLAGGALFLALESSGWLPRSTRLSLLGGHSDGASGARDLDVTLFGMRAETCPLSWSLLPELVVEPCAGGEAGLIRGAGDGPGGATDYGFWGAVQALGRVELHVHGPLWLEAQLGARVPLVRYEMGTRDGSEDWFRTRAVGLDAGVGASWQIW